jgi:O-antigen/teichoic acid export membrane protein
VQPPHPLASFAFKAISSPLEKLGRFAVVLVAAPVLGATDFGAYQFASTTAALLAACTELGLSTWTTRTLARERGRPATGTMGVGLRLRAMAAVPFGALLGVVASTQASGTPRRALLIFGVAALANAFVDYFAAILRGRESFGDEAAMNAGRALLTTAIALGALSVARSVVGLATGMMLGALLSAAGGFGLLRRRYGQADLASQSMPARNHERLRATLREALPLWLSGLLAMLYFRSDIIFVHYLAGEAEVGAYAAAYRIFEGAMLFPAAVMAVAFPRLARARHVEGSATRLELRLGCLLLTSGVLVAAALWLLDDRIVLLLLGKTFARSALTLRVLALVVPVLFVNYSLTSFVLARGRERRFVGVLATMLVLNVLLNVLLVPRLGGMGAAWATLATEIALLAACVALLASGRPLRKAGP